MNASMTRARIEVANAADAMAIARDALRAAASATPQAATGLLALSDAADEARRGFLAEVAEAFDHGLMEVAVAGKMTGPGRRSDGASHPVPFTF